MVEFNTILKLCRVLMFAHSFPKSMYRCLPDVLNLGVSEVTDLACLKGVGPMVGDAIPQGFIMS